MYRLSTRSATRLALALLLVVSHPLWAATMGRCAAGGSVEHFASTSRPIGMHFDANGDLLVANTNSVGTISKVSIVNGANAGVSILAGPSSALHYPEYIDLDNDGHIFTVSTNLRNGTVYRIDPSGSPVMPFWSGSGQVFNDGRGVAFDGSGDLFITNNIVPSLDSFVDGFVSKLERNAVGVPTGITDIFISPFNDSEKPLDLEFAGNGDLFIASDRSVTKVTFSGGVVSTVDKDFAMFPTAGFRFAAGLGIDPQGGLWASEIIPGNSTGGTVYSVSSTGALIPFATGFNEPYDIVFDANGCMYVSDFLADAIYRICSDSDGDGINDAVDICLDTAIPESIPTNHLGVNRWALVDDDDMFDTTPPPGGGGGPNFEFTIQDTAGCSCEQIIEAMALGWGHTKFGCSTGAMLQWIAQVGGAGLAEPEIENTPGGIQSLTEGIDNTSSPSMHGTTSDDRQRQRLFRQRNRRQN